MNIPNLFLADLPPEATLSPQLIRDACIAVKRNRASWLQHRRTQELIELLAYAAERFLQPDYGLRRLALELAPAETGFGRSTLERGMDGFFRSITSDSLQSLVQQDLGDSRRLDEFAAPTGELRQGRLALARGPELLAHITAGNLPNSGLSSLTMGVLTKSAQFMKLPRNGTLLPRLFAHALADLEPKLGSCIELATWAGGDEPLESVLFTEADCVTVHGSDDTLRSVASRLPRHCRFLGYGHRLSFGFVGQDQLSIYQARKIAMRAAEDIAAWNQLGCLSPHVFYVEERGPISPEGFAELLADALADIERTDPRGHLSLENSAEISGRRSLHELRGARHASTREEAHTMPRGAFFDIPRAGTRVWSSPDSTAWTVVYEEEPRFQTSCLNRFIYIKPCRDLADALHQAEPIRGRVSTVGVATSEARMQELAPVLARWGISRICPVGKMQLPPAGWRHDGRPALADLVTWTDWETL